MFGGDFQIDKLERQLAVLEDIINTAFLDIETVTSTRTVCQALLPSAMRRSFTEIHKLLCLYLTVPITSAMSKQTVSSLRTLLTYLPQTMTQQRL